jgi:tight adherence protein B
MALVAGAALAAALLVAAGRPRARRPPAPTGATTPVAPPLVQVQRAMRRVVERAAPGRRLDRRDAQLPDALDRLAAALRAGQAIGPALVELAATAPDPLGPELRRVAGRLAHGASVAAALAHWAGAPGTSADVRLVAAALTLGAEAGGEVARAVDRISVTLRERAELRGEVRALATQARASAAVLTLAPLGFAALVATVEPDAIAFLLTTPVGLVCLALGLALDAAGAAWMSRITRSAA